jgi:hypothetical protein
MSLQVPSVPQRGPGSINRMIFAHVLVQAPELNGKAGVTCEFNGDKGRYSVKVEGRAKTAALKPQNIMVQAQARK